MQPTLGMAGNLRWFSTSSGHPAIAYETDSTINYAANDGTGWTIYTVYDDPLTTGYPGGSSLQLPNDDLDQPRISFIDDDGSVRLAYWDEMDPSCPGTDGDFNCPIIDDFSTFRSFTSLVVEQSPLYNLSRIVYIDETTGELRYRFESTPDVWGSQAIGLFHQRRTFFISGSRCQRTSHRLHRSGRHHIKVCRD